MASSNARRPARRTALVVGAGAVALVAALLALGVAQQRSGSPDDTLDALTAASSAPPTVTSSTSRSAPSSATPTVISAAWPSDVGEAELMGSLDTAWAVWLGVWRYEDRADPPLPFEGRLAELGYDPAPIPVPCFAGSVEQLGLDPIIDYWGSPLYFRTTEEAQAFVELWSQPVYGITEGSISCDWG